MKSLSGKAFWGLVALLFLVSPVSASGTQKTFYLEGLEVAKGVDIGTIRVGTSFAGKVLDENLMERGLWFATLSHRGAANIEVCGGTNDIVSLRLVVSFCEGEHAGGQLVLTMTDLRGIPDVHWIYNYSGTPCRIGGLDCDACSPDAARVSCSDENSPSSNLAVIRAITLTRAKGSTLAVKRAVLKEGQLCHYYPFIPRVHGKLELTF